MDGAILNDDFVIHLIFQYENMVKVMGCRWDNGIAISIVIATMMGLSQYLYIINIIELNRLKLQHDNPKVKNLMGDIRKFSVYFKNPNFLNGSLEAYQPTRN